MKATAFVRICRIRGFGGRLLIACLFLVGASGCAPAATQPLPTAAPSPIPTATVLAQPTIPAGWQTDTPALGCGFTISHPAELQGSQEGTYSWLIQIPVSELDQAARNFIYVTAVPGDFQGGTEGAYNYDPAEADLLLGLQVGEAKALRDAADTAPWFTYTRMADVTLSGQAAQAYENLQPWEFPPGTKEIRYYLKANDCTYQIGGYLAAPGSDQLGAIPEDLFNQVVATFQMTP
jgi:hypothetical protein